MYKVMKMFVEVAWIQ